MARPINATAVRRRDGEGTIEVRSSGGHWIPFSMLGWAAQSNLFRTMREKGYGDVFPSNGGFYYDLSVQNMQQPQPPQRQEQQVESPDSQDTEGPTDDVSPDDSDDEQDGPFDTDQPDSKQDQQTPNKENSEMMVEDIIRRIANELDDKRETKMNQTLESLTESWNQKLDELQVNAPTAPTTQLVTVCNRVEVVAPDVNVVRDGLFHMSMPDLLFNMQMGIHTYLPGSPGTGKSHAAAQAAEILGGMFGSISFGPTTPESRLVGGMTADGSFFEPMLLKLVRYAMENPDSYAFMCLDEMDNGHAGVQATLNSIMANGWMTAPNGDHLTVGKNLAFIACANTYGTGPTAEFSGRNKLDAATLDRFAYLPWEIDTGLEEVLVRRYFADDQQHVASHWLDVWRTARANVAANGLKMFVTPRGAQMGAKMIAAGRPVDKALAQVLGNKVPSDQWSKINPL
jgi:hypothetical protein